MSSASHISLEKSVDLDKVNIRLLEEGIVLDYIKFGKLIEADDVYEIRNHNLNMVNYQPYGVIVESDDLTSFSKEARDLAASKEINCQSAAKALLIKGLGQRIIANFYLKFNKPFVPTKIFENKESACVWIREEIQKDRRKRKLSN